MNQKNDNKSFLIDIETITDIFKRRLGLFISFIMILIVSGPTSFWIYNHFAKQNEVIYKICERKIEDEWLTSTTELIKWESVNLTLQTTLNIIEKMNKHDNLNIWINEYKQIIFNVNNVILEKYKDRNNFNRIERIKECIKMEKE